MKKFLLLILFLVIMSVGTCYAQVGQFHNFDVSEVGHNNPTLLSVESGMFDISNIRVHKVYDVLAVTIQVVTAHTEDSITEQLVTYYVLGNDVTYTTATIVMHTDGTTDVIRTQSFEQSVKEPENKKYGDWILKTYEVMKGMEIRGFYLNEQGFLVPRQTYRTTIKI